MIERIIVLFATHPEESSTRAADPPFSERILSKIMNLPILSSFAKSSRGLCRFVPTTNAPKMGLSTVGTQLNLRHNCTFLFFVLLLFTSVELELTFFSIDTRQSVCRRLPKHDCLSAVTSCPSGMYVCLWREQTTDGRCLFGAFVTSNTVYWSNLRKIPKALELSKKKNITTTRTGSTAECASCMHLQTITRGEKKIEPQHLDKLFIIRHLVPLRHNHCYEQVHSCSAVRCCTRSTSRHPSNSNSMRSKDASIPSRTETSPTVQNCTLRVHSQQTWPPLQTLSSAHKAHNVSVPATQDFMAHRGGTSKSQCHCSHRQPVIHQSQTTCHHQP